MLHSPVRSRLDAFRWSEIIFFGCHSPKEFYR